MRSLWSVLVLVALCAGCSSGPSEAEWPAKAGIFLDQPRTLRGSHTVVLRVDNQTSNDLVVDRVTLRSPRIGTVESQQVETVRAGYGADLELELPTGRCGGAVEATVTLDYRTGGRDLRSEVEPEDKYAAVARLLDIDCAGREVDAAATLTAETPRIEGSGRDAVASVPIRIEPTGDRSDVVLTGFGTTTLLSTTLDEPNDPIVLDGRTRTVQLRLVPTRCDAHALADNKVGTQIPMTMRSERLDDGRLIVPMDPDVEAALVDYWVSTCGLGD